MGLSYFHADSEDWSDCAHAQADLTLRCAHINLVCFVVARLIYTICYVSVPGKSIIQSNFNGSNTFGTMKISSRQG